MQEELGTIVQEGKNMKIEIDLENKDDQFDENVLSINLLGDIVKMTLWRRNIMKDIVDPYNYNPRF